MAGGDKEWVFAGHQFVSIHTHSFRLHGTLSDIEPPFWYIRGTCAFSSILTKRIHCFAPAKAFSKVSQRDSTQELFAFTEP
jgi:hypothetical protein